MVKKNLTIKIPKPEIKKIIVKPYRPPSEIKKILRVDTTESERLTTAKSENTSEKVPIKNTDLNSFLVSE